MHIAFLGFDNSFCFNHIGGMDSLVRRLALRLAGTDATVDLVHYGASEEQTDSVQKGVEQRFFRRFDDAMAYVADACDHVVVIYVRPRDRLAAARFRRRLGNSVRFHCLYSSWHESRLKRELLFAEARLWPFNGCAFCVSPRIHRYVKRWAPRSALLLPPVPRDYFRQCSEKSDHGKLRVTYAGRIDPGKGVTVAAHVFRRLAQRNDIHTRLCGFAWSHDPQTLALHEELLADPAIRYEPVDCHNWSPQMESALVQVLRETDVLLLPYRRLSSTVDTPLLVLEGMASLCALITPPLGDLHETYGPSPFNLHEGWDIDAIVKLIEEARLHLEGQRQRSLQRNAVLQFDADDVASRFQRLLHECA